MNNSASGLFFFAFSAVSFCEQVFVCYVCYVDQHKPDSDTVLEDVGFIYTFRDVKLCLQLKLNIFRYPK